MPMVSSVIFVISYACPRGLRAALYPFRPLAKVAVDLTPLRSSKTKRQTIQPPPQISIPKCWSVALVSHKSWDMHKTSGIKPRQVQIVMGWMRARQESRSGRTSFKLPLVPKIASPVCGRRDRRRCVYCGLTDSHATHSGLFIVSNGPTTANYASAST